VQPYINYQWNGSLTMYPSEDSWFDTNYLPDEIVDAGVYSVTHNTPKNWLDSLVSANSNKPTFLKETFETTTPVAFIRNRKVSVTGVGFLPNSKLNFFFDEVNVNAYVRPVGGILGADVISNGTGNFDAEFEIPCSATLRFRCGERILKVINTTGNGEISSTSGVASYVANGLSNNYRKTYITTRHEISSTNTQGVSVLYPDPNVGSPSQPSGYVDSPSSGFYGGPGALSGIAPSPTGLDGPGAAAAGIAAGIAASAIGLDGPGVAAAVAAGAAAADGADASIGGLW
jgi:hypothetical protein